MTLRDQILAFLIALERRIPPPQGQHHSLTFAQYGSDFTGWENKLCLQLQYHSGMQKFFLEESDFLRPFSELTNDLHNEIRGR